MTFFESQILSYLQRPVTTSGDPSLALGMTWKLGGYWGEEVAIRDTCYHFVKLHLRIFNTVYKHYHQTEHFDTTLLSC